MTGFRAELWIYLIRETSPPSLTAESPAFHTLLFVSHLIFPGTDNTIIPEPHGEDFDGFGYIAISYGDTSAWHIE